MSYALPLVGRRQRYWLALAYLDDPDVSLFGRYVEGRVLIFITFLKESFVTLMLQQMLQGREVNAVILFQSLNRLSTTKPFIQTPCATHKLYRILTVLSSSLEKKRTSKHQRSYGNVSWKELHSKLRLRVWRSCYRGKLFRKTSRCDCIA